MDYKKLATVCAALAMCLVLLALGVRLWANSKRHTLSDLVTLHTGRDGRIFVLLGNDFYLETESGQSLGVISAHHFGLNHLDRDFAVLSDESILLPAQDPASSTFSEDLQRYARMRDTSTDNSPGTTALQHCSLQTFKCFTLTGEGDYFHFRQSYRLAVNEAAGLIYVADTARQRLLILNMDGKVLAVKTSGLWFPNGIQLSGPGQIEVADTNHHRIVTIAINGDKFGKDVSSVNPSMAGHIWPFGIARDRSGTLWVVVANNDMGHGKLVRWPHPEKQGREIPLPENAEPSYPVALADGSILLPDSVLYRIYHFAPDGSRLPDFGSPVLKARLQVLAKHAHWYGALFDYGWIIIAVLALPLLHLTFYFQRLAGRNSATQSFTFGTKSNGVPTTVNPAMAWRATKYVFVKRRSVTDAGSTRILIGIILVMVTFLGGMLYFLSRMPHHVSRHAISSNLNNQVQMAALLIVGMMYVIYLWLSRSHERLYLSHTGIRYQTWLAGPLGFLTRFYPDWQLRWQDISDIRLCSRGNGKSPIQWQYELRFDNGRVRRISALFWRLQDKSDNTGLTLWNAMKRNPQILRDAIGRTALYRLLELSTRTAEHRTL